MWFFPVLGFALEEKLLHGVKCCKYFKPEGVCNKILPLVHKTCNTFSVTGGIGSAIHIEYVDFVPELG